MRDRLARISWVWVLIGWTVFQWVSRLRNVINNDELSTSGRTIRVLVVVVFVALAGATAVALRRRSSLANNVLVVFLCWTVGYWLVRGIGILIDGDYSAGFKLVHTVLMVISLSLSALTTRQLVRRR